eukprot:TRINITY_DN9801_c0_g1_i1.p1 TRINITY_DN9801_c0_g1~~TRINITY_DN9801_c0_g1_i1.p1  ORF type:complete len:846 (+),score=141.58 TRINITY_DN9801_c0_g1_i1:54-2540(+)
MPSEGSTEPTQSQTTSRQCPHVRGAAGFRHDACVLSEPRPQESPTVRQKHIPDDKMLKGATNDADGLCPDSPCHRHPAVLSGENLDSVLNDSPPMATKTAQNVMHRQGATSKASGKLRDRVVKNRVQEVKDQCKVFADLAELGSLDDVLNADCDSDESDCSESSDGSVDILLTSRELPQANRSSSSPEEPPSDQRPTTRLQPRSQSEFVPQPPPRGPDRPARRPFQSGSKKVQSCGGSLNQRRLAAPHTSRNTPAVKIDAQVLERHVEAFEDASDLAMLGDHVHAVSDSEALDASKAEHPQGVACEAGHAMRDRRDVTGRSRRKTSEKLRDRVVKSRVQEVKDMCKVFEDLSDPTMLFFDIDAVSDSEESDASESSSSSAASVRILSFQAPVQNSRSCSSSLRQAGKSEQSLMQAAVHPPDQRLAVPHASRNTPSVKIDDKRYVEAPAGASDPTTMLGAHQSAASDSEALDASKVEQPEDAPRAFSDSDWPLHTELKQPAVQARCQTDFILRPLETFGEHTQAGYSEALGKASSLCAWGDYTQAVGRISEARQKFHSQSIQDNVQAKLHSQGVARVAEHDLGRRRDVAGRFRRKTSEKLRDRVVKSRVQEVKDICKVFEDLSELTMPADVINAVSDSEESDASESSSSSGASVTILGLQAPMQDSSSCSSSLRRAEKSEQSLMQAALNPPDQILAVPHASRNTPSVKIDGKRYVEAPEAASDLMMLGDRQSVSSNIEALDASQVEQPEDAPRPSSDSSGPLNTELKQPVVQARCQTDFIPRPPETSRRCLPARYATSFEKASSSGCAWEGSTQAVRKGRTLRRGCEQG